MSNSEKYANEDNEHSLCANCGKKGNDLIKCASCDSVSYCGPACMKSHRAQHKKACRKLVKKKPKGGPKPTENLRFKGKELRFKYGDKVTCRVGDEEWQPGTIVQLLYKQLGQKFPYQIRLDVDGVLICAPIDDDTCIKAATKKVPLRFKVGDRVACRCGEWKHGTVINTWWYDTMQGVSHPYQVKLDEGYLVFAPKDLDNYIQQPLQNIDPKSADTSSATPSIPGVKENGIDLKLSKMGLVDVISKELRFKVGDRVQCLTEIWEPGIVIKLWYEEDDDIYPYQIRLDSKVLIYAPLDSDDYIKVSLLPPPDGLFVEENDPLFKDPVVKENDCPICFLPTPFADQCIFQPCCGKEICSGCYHATFTLDDTQTSARQCPFCRTPGAKNNKEIITRLRRRIESKDPIAAVTLAGFYHDGQHGLQMNYKKSFELFKLAEELGSTECLSQLGWAYWKGEGVKMDMEKARHYLQLAAMEGNVHARGNLAWIEFDEGNPWKAYKHFVIAAKFGLTEAMVNVREGYTNGFVSKEEFTAVLRSFQKLKLEKSSTHRDKAAKHDAYEKRSH